MQVKTSDLYALIGMKEVELANLKGALIQAHAEIAKLKPEPALKDSPNAPPMPAG